jgi:ribosome-associated protein
VSRLKAKLTKVARRTSTVPHFKEHVLQKWLEKRLPIAEDFRKIYSEKESKVGTNKVRTSESESRLPKPSNSGSKVDSRHAAFMAANSAESKKGHGTLVLDVAQVTVLADYFVIAGGETPTQVRAIVDAIDGALAQLGMKARSIEGKKEGRWVLMDYESIIVHVLHERERNFYKLEQFWNHALIVDRLEWLEDVTDADVQETPRVRRQYSRKRPEDQT